MPGYNLFSFFKLECNKRNIKMRHIDMLRIFNIVTKKKITIDKLYTIDISDNDKSAIIPFLLQLEKGYPIAYLTNQADFLDYVFYVNENVLIPREETAEIVEKSVKLIKDNFNQKEINIAEVGVGSGCIVTSLYLKLKDTYQLSIYGTDISSSALEVAKINSENYNANITLLKGNTIDPLIKEGVKFDVLISNPPYIADDIELDKSIIYEPKSALIGGKNGIEIYQEIFLKIKEILKPHSLLIFEIGYNQSEILYQLAHSYFPTSIIKIENDFNNLPRMLIIHNPV